MQNTRELTEILGKKHNVTSRDTKAKHKVLNRDT